MLFERGSFVTDGLPFPALRAAARINDAARDAGPDADFSRLIREGRPGFQATAGAAGAVPPSSSVGGRYEHHDDLRQLHLPFIPPPPILPALRQPYASPLSS